MEISELGYHECATRTIERVFHTLSKRNRFDNLENPRSAADDARMT